MTTDDKAPKKYLTPAEVAARFDGRISPQTLSNWRNLGSGPAYLKLGGKVLYPIDRLVEWEQRNTVQSTSQYSKGNAA